MLTVPLRIEGREANGEPFRCEGRTVTVSRYGARIQARHPLTSGQKLLITNLINQRSANFCVIGLLESYPQGGGEWGVASTDADADLWGIFFPETSDEPQQPKALLECRQCHAVAVAHLSQLEIEVLDGGLVRLPCANCKTDTPWGFPTRPVAMPGPPGEGPMQSLDPVQPARAELEPLREPRFPVQRAITIRIASGEAESILSENTSREGICFTSEKPYETGQEVTIIWRPGNGQRNLAARGRIVRRQDLGGTLRKVYGVRFESPPILEPALTGLSLGWLYAVYWTGAVAAAVALAAGFVSLGTHLYVPLRFEKFVLFAVIGLLLLFLIIRFWKLILLREPEDDPTIRNKHRLTIVISGSLLVIGLAAGAGFGAWRALKTVRYQAFLRDLTVAEAIETKIDSMKGQKFSGPDQFQTGCRALSPLVRQWNTVLNQVSADVSQLDTRGPGEQAWKFRQFVKILDVEREKSALLTGEISLAQQLAEQSGDERRAFWDSKVAPLRDEELHLDARKRELVNELASQ